MEAMQAHLDTNLAEWGEATANNMSNQIKETLKDNAMEVTEKEVKHLKTGES